MLKKIWRFILGSPRNPLDQRTRHAIALTAFFAWIGLGADGLSSSCYGPEQSYLALGQHPQLALYLAVITGLTVFIISFAYNQVIELFPNGGGGYKVATKLIGPRAGLVAGSALIVDYVLTIVISIASGADAIFSLLPLAAQSYKLEIETFLIIVLVILNLRGMKESIKILMPIFVGFVITHFILIVYGITIHGSNLPIIVHNAVHETHFLAVKTSLFFVVALFLHAYSLGGGTYTGLEAVSNNVNTLAEPRVKTGKWTMFYMAISLSFTAAGIILLYLLWSVHPIPGQTLNAVVFRHILGSWNYAHPMLILTLFFEAGLLFVSANTGFLGGPAVLANMAMDRWMPNRYRYLSSRLVTQNGVVLFGIAALLILYATDGHVALLVVLYSVNVFLAFMVSIFGLCCYWVKQRGKKPKWLRRLLLSSIGFIICAVILVIIVASKFFDGGWEAVLFTGAVITFCFAIRKHYYMVEKQLKKIDELLIQKIEPNKETVPEFDVSASTAVFFIGDSRGAGMHTLLWAQRLFPNHFKNFVFISVGAVDVESYGGEQRLQEMQTSVQKNLQYFKAYADSIGIPSKIYSAYGTDVVHELAHLAEQTQAELANAIFFASQLVLPDENWFTRQLHSYTSFSIQRRLHLAGIRMFILPMKLSIDKAKPIPNEAKGNA